MAPVTCFEMIRYMKEPTTGSDDLIWPESTTAVEVEIEEDVPMKDPTYPARPPYGAPTKRLAGPPHEPIRIIENRLLGELAQTIRQASEQASVLSDKEQREGRVAGACFYAGVEHGLSIAAWLVSNSIPDNGVLSDTDLEYVKALGDSYLGYLRLRATEERLRSRSRKEEPTLEQIVGSSAPDLAGSVD